MCVIFMRICIKNSQNSLVSKSEKFLELALKPGKLWQNKKGQKCTKRKQDEFAVEKSG
jgi:hypothetical protein